MTRVRLRVNYISRGVRGRPGQVVDLDDTAAAALVAKGRAVRVDGKATDAAPAQPKAKRRRRKPPAEDRFLNPDAGPSQFDPSGGRDIVPKD